MPAFAKDDSPFISVGIGSLSNVADSRDFQDREVDVSATSGNASWSTRILVEAWTRNPSLPNHATRCSRPPCLTSLFGDQNKPHRPQRTAPGGVDAERSPGLLSRLLGEPDLFTALTIFSRH
jgi:hypothetical protein